MTTLRLPGLAKACNPILQGTTMLSSAQQERSDRLLDEVWEAGGHSFDTARVYGGGKCEQALGTWLRKRRLGGQAFVLSKGCHPTAGDPRRVSPAHIAADITSSLDCYDTACIDLYLLHRDDLQVPVGELVDALASEQLAGRIGAFGASNWTTLRIAEANDYARSRGLPPMVASSPNFTLARVVEVPWPGCVTISGPQGATERGWYAQQHMPVFAWSSLAHGFFTGRITRESVTTVTDPHDQLCVKAFASDDNFTRQDRTRQLALRLGTSPSRIVLAYVLSDPVQVLPIVGSHTGAEFLDNAAALQVTLTSAQREWLDLRRAAPD